MYFDDSPERRRELRIAAVCAAVGIIAFIIGSIAWSGNGSSGTTQAQTPSTTPTPEAPSSETPKPDTKPVTLQGIVAPELESFFTHDDVVAALNDQGITLDIETADAHSMVGKAEDNPRAVDFYAPALDGEAQEITSELGKELTLFGDFETPLGVVMERRYVEDMAAARLADKAPNDVRIFDVEEFIEMIEEDATWGEISPDLNPDQPVRVALPDINSSAAAQRFAAFINKESGHGLFSYDKGADTMREAIEQNGEVGATTAELLSRMIESSPHEIPAVLSTEAEYVALRQEGAIPKEYEFLALKWKASLDARVIPSTAEGERLAEAISSPEFEELLQEQFYRIPSEAQRVPEDSTFARKAGKIGYTPATLWATVQQGWGFYSWLRENTQPSATGP